MYRGKVYNPLYRQESGKIEVMFIYPIFKVLEYLFVCSYEFIQKNKYQNQIYIFLIVKPEFKNLLFINTPFVHRLADTQRQL